MGVGYWWNQLHCCKPVKFYSGLAHSAQASAPKWPVLYRVKWLNDQEIVSTTRHCSCPAGRLASRYASSRQEQSSRLVPNSQVL